jgi:hypothetical protein
MPNWQGLVSIYDEWITVLFIFTAAERLRSTSCSTGRITVVIVFAKGKTAKQYQPTRQLTRALDEFK